MESVECRLRPTGLVFGNPHTELPTIQVAENRFAFGTNVSLLATAYAKNDNQTVGELLGYPECCRDFFDRTWGSGDLDTTAQMAGDGNGPTECNILGRWLGVRFVPHLPCSWNCSATVAFARTLQDLWPEEELRWATKILSWPVEWSALHGIAEVKYPVVKLSTRTTPGPLQRVRRAGIAPPKESAAGVSFPFEVRLPWRMNGFSSREAMNAGHEMILTELKKYPPQGLVIDLGCGNGHLMQRVQKTFNIDVFGVECDKERVGSTPNIIIGDLRQFSELPNADTILVSRRRFEEIPLLEPWCYAHARQVLVYLYDAPMCAEMKVA